VDNVPDPKIEDSRDIVIRVTSTAICGSDLHLYDGFMPTMQRGDVIGHEPMGIVEELGASVKNLKRGDRVVVPFNLSCGKCWFCSREMFSCATNRTAMPRSPGPSWDNPPPACSAIRTCSAAIPAGRRNICACRTAISVR